MDALLLTTIEMQRREGQNLMALVTVRISECIAGIRVAEGAMYVTLRRIDRAECMDSCLGTQARISSVDVE